MSKRRLSEEHKRKMSETMMGRTFSDEHKAKISAAHKGKVLSEETKAKMSKSHKGKRLSEEQKAKMRDRKLSPVTKDKIREAVSRNNIYHFVNPEGEYVMIRGSLNQFCGDNSLDTGTMCKVHKGERITHKGWTKFDTTKKT